jgi:hypothetical protein
MLIRPCVITQHIPNNKIVYSISKQRNQVTFMSWPLIIIPIAFYLMRDKTVEKTKKALNKWVPDVSCKREIDYRNDLFQYLRQHSRRPLL